MRGLRPSCVAIASLVSPYRGERDRVRAIHEEAGIPFFEVFVDTSLEECERRDPKGLYAAAFAGEITDFTGVSAPYEEPLDPELRVDTTDQTPTESAQLVLDTLAALNLTTAVVA